MSVSPETTQVVVTDSSPVTRDDSNASDIPHADSLSALDKTSSTAMADIVSTQDALEADVADKEVIDVVTKDVPLQVAEDALAGILDSKVEEPTGSTLLATDAPAPIPPVEEDTAVTETEVAEDATVAKPTPVTVTAEEEARPEKAFSQEDTKEAVSTLPTIAQEPAGADDTIPINTEDKGLADAKEHDIIHFTSSEEDDTKAAPTDTISTDTTVQEVDPLDSNTALLSSKDAIPVAEIAEAKEDVTLTSPEPSVQLVVPVDDIKPNFSGLEDGASQDELSSNQAENLPLQQGAIEGLLTDKDEQEPEIAIEPEMTFAAPSSPILPASKPQPQEDVPGAYPSLFNLATFQHAEGLSAVPQEPEAVAAEPVVDINDEEVASAEAEAVPEVDQKAVEEVKDEEKPVLESVDSTIPAQDEPVADTAEDVIVQDEATSAGAESNDEPVSEKVDAEEAAPVVEATEAKPEEEAGTLDQDQPKVEDAAEESAEVAAPVPEVVEEAAAPEPVPEEESVAEDVKPADAVAAQEQPAVEGTPEEPVVEEEAQPEVLQKSAIDLEEKAEETVATEKDEVVDEVPFEAAAVPVETEQVDVEEPVVEAEKEAQEPVQVAVKDEEAEPEPVKIEEEKAEEEPVPELEEKILEVEEREPEPVKVEEQEEAKAEEPTVEKREPEPEPVKVEEQEPAEVEKPHEEPLKVEEPVEAALVEKSVEHEATEEPEEQPASVDELKETPQSEEHEEKAAEVKEIEQEPVKFEESEEKSAELESDKAEVIEKAEEPEHAALEVDQTATEPAKAEEPLEVEEPVASELEQKPVETEVLEKELVKEELLEQEAEPVKEEPEQKAYVQVDSAEEDAAKAEELDQASDATAEEDRSSVEPQLATHSVTATDSSADSVVEPTTPSIVIQNLEAVGTSGDDEVEHAEPALAAQEIERPKSPWTPSFTVTTLGGPVTETEQDDAEDEPKPEQATVSLLVTDDDGKVQAPEESTPAPPARPWTPSYSVHSQGNSPIQTPTLLEDEVPEAPLEKETETPSHVPSLDEVAEPQPAEVPVPTQPILESTTNEDVPSEDVEVSTERSARVDNADSPVLKTDSATEETGTVEETTVEPIAETPSVLNENAEGSDKLAPVVPNEGGTETAAVDEEANKVESVSKASEQEESPSAVTPENDEAPPEAPKPELVEETPVEEPTVPLLGESLSAKAIDVASPVPLVAPVPVVGSSSWVPSYSVSRQGSRQGSPAPRSQDIGEDDGAAAAKESVPASEAVEDSVLKDAPAISETETNAISVPAGGQEVIARSWTPSYSVTTQGPIAEPDLSAAQDGKASSAVPEEPEAPTASDIEEPQASDQQTSASETLKEIATNGAAAVEDAEPEPSSAYDDCPTSY
ncbi:hypothetical protein EST38_g1568 [Candolleomyces aberdarensis]|uniref:Uncharacterized protein n=1 Tax=Candolleomyces aberdarensis TaxID=2316362 RepID=A0A4Q2DVS0_9AGAR|nr:hypothetical protein EST38_g1568 [Candolleomyces aberdarensis]